MIAKLYGEAVIELPVDLYIPPDALEIVLEAFEGPLDLLLYLIRKENLNILDIPMAPLTRQYLEYVEIMRTKNLELAAEYLVMAAMLMEIKSRLLLPRPPSVAAEGGRGRSSRDLISISIAAITRYSAASSRFFVRINSTYSRYWRVSGAIGMSRMFKFSLRIRYKRRSKGPSNASSMTSSASGGI